MSYMVDGREYDYDSCVNQEIKRKFVDQHVIACITDMADALFDYEDCGQKYADYSEFSNYWVKKCPRCGEEIDLENCTMVSESDLPDKDIYKDNAYVCCGCEEIIAEDEIDEEPAENLEYYIVSEFLGRRLRDEGCCVLPRTLGWIWGRCVSGQAILLDGVISDICEGMEILEGQSNSWERKES